MATIRHGDKSVLLVIDVQVGVVRRVWDAPRIISNIGTVVGKARSEGVPVVWVQHSDAGLIHGSSDWQLVSELAPLDGETRIQKHFNSSFEQTSLEETLARLGATHLVITGAVTNLCVRATLHAGLDRGYDVTLVTDAHTTEPIELEDGTKVEAASIVNELNTAMTWLRYPEREISTVSTDGIEFAG